MTCSLCLLLIAHCPLPIVANGTVFLNNKTSLPGVVQNESENIPIVPDLGNASEGIEVKTNGF